MLANARFPRGIHVMTDDDVNECIDELLDATGEGTAAFHAAAGDVRSEEARALLLDRAQRFGRAASALRALAAERGLDGRACAAADSVPRAAPADEAGILAECERLETAVIVAFRDALERALPDPVRAVVACEFERLLASLGTLRTARDRAARQHREVVGRPV
jgi:hypothetical protein